MSEKKTEHPAIKLELGTSLVVDGHEVTVVMVRTEIDISGYVFLTVEADNEPIKHDN